MGTDDRIEQATLSALNRIKALNFNAEQLDAALSLDLVNQYLSLSARWSIALSEQTRWPFFDIANCVNSTFKLSESVDSEFTAWKSQTLTTSYIQDICYWHIKFERLNAEKHVCASYRLDRPYEPLVLLFEHGLSFTLEHGFIDVAGFGIPYFNSSPSTWLKRK